MFNYSLFFLKIKITNMDYVELIKPCFEPQIGILFGACFSYLNINYFGHWKYFFRSLISALSLAIATEESYDILKFLPFLFGFTLIDMFDYFGKGGIVFVLHHMYVCSMLFWPCIGISTEPIIRYIAVSEVSTLIYHIGRWVKPTGVYATFTRFAFITTFIITRFKFINVKNFEHGTLEYNVVLLFTLMNFAWSFQIVYAFLNHIK